MGDRYIIPQVSVNISGDGSEYVQKTEQSYFFDVSEENVDALGEKNSSANASNFVSTIKTQMETEGGCFPFSVNSSIDNQDTYFAKIILKLYDTVNDNGAIVIDAHFDICVDFMADVQYTSDDILSVFQQENSTDSAWTKFGYNATLNATATKIESNSFQDLQAFLENKDQNGNANLTEQRGVDDYQTAVVYKDIDIYNIDINTGELIGKLSDTNYKFEWFGRDVILTQGTTLASGRTLSEAETFTVDCYTYYPKMYIRRWVVGDKQWISVSDKQFRGASKINEYFSATFETTLYNPDKTVATIDYGTENAHDYKIIPRSYVTEARPLVSGRNAYLQEHYNYGLFDGYTSEPTQTRFLEWSANLTNKWKAYQEDRTNPESLNYVENYRGAKGCQGENYVAHIWNLLYLVKYANNDSQAMVGSGNCLGNSLYGGGDATNHVKILDEHGAEIDMWNNGVKDTIECMLNGAVGSGTLAVYNPNAKGTHENAYKTENTITTLKGDDGIYNEAGMNYGNFRDYEFDNSLNNGNDKKGLYVHQFLSYVFDDNTMPTDKKRVLLDGYAGSDRYTSVFCLGKCNPWGNVYKWIFGEAIISDKASEGESGGNLHIFVNFDNFNSETKNWCTINASGAYEYKLAKLKDINGDSGYVETSYTLPTENSQYNHCGTSLISGNESKISLIGFPTSTSGKNEGLKDYSYLSTSPDYIFGILVGGDCVRGANVGAFCFHMSSEVSAINCIFGFRTSLIFS